MCIYDLCRCTTFLCEHWIYCWLNFIALEHDKRSDFLLYYLKTAVAAAEDDDDAIVEDDLGKSRDGSRTDDEVVQR